MIRINYTELRHIKTQTNYLIWWWELDLWEDQPHISSMIKIQLNPMVKQSEVVWVRETRAGGLKINLAHWFGSWMRSGLLVVGVSGLNWLQHIACFQKNMFQRRFYHLGTLSLLEHHVSFAARRFHSQELKLNWIIGWFLRSDCVAAKVPLSVSVCISVWRVTISFGESCLVNCFPVYGFWWTILNPGIKQAISSNQHSRMSEAWSSQRMESNEVGCERGTDHLQKWTEGLWNEPRHETFTHSLCINFSPRPATNYQLFSKPRPFSTCPMAAPRYGTPVKGQVLGGRWKPLHYLYRSVVVRSWELRWSVPVDDPRRVRLSSSPSLMVDKFTNKV